MSAKSRDAVNEQPSLGEARAAGLAPPESWKPPRRATLSEVARSAGAVLRCTARLLPGAFTAPGRWPASTTAAGLARIARTARATLADLGVELEVVGADRVPPQGGLTFMWNQQSHLDHLVLPCVIPRPFFSLFNNAVAQKPLYGAYLRRSGHVHVDKDDEAQWRPAIAHAAARIAAGECVLVSPEGTRSWDGRLLPMKRGALSMAIQSQRPIVCVTLVGGHACLPRGARAVRPGTIVATFSPPISTLGHDPERREPLERAVTRAFEAVLEAAGG